MEKRASMDAMGAIGLISFSLLLATNQVVVKLVNEGLQPVFFAGIRSVAAAVIVAMWLRARGMVLTLPRRYWGVALAMGACFAFEFIGLFTALDLTTVTRSSVIFYSMPVWLALGAHFVMPGERITLTKGIGLALAFSGAATAILFRGGSGASSGGGHLALIGDFCALAGAWGWAGLVLIARATRMNELAPARQHFWQLAVSGPILLIASLAFGPFIRDFQVAHLWGLGFQIVVVAAFGFLFWIWLLSIYPASSVAAFSFLAPVFGIGAGWLLLGEQIGPSTLVAGALVAGGLVLINRPVRPPPAPMG